MDRKKMAAVTAAIFTYIKTEEEAACCVKGAGKEQLQPITSCGVAPHHPSVWGAAGRSTQMQMRSMMQMRAFK